MKKSIIGLMFLFAFNVSAVTIKGDDGNTVEINNPKRIVTINATTTEIVMALGKKDLIVGTDSSAISLTGAEGLQNLGHPYRFGVEGIISLKPDLVIATSDNLLGPVRTQLRDAKVPVLVLESSFANGVSGLKNRIRMISLALNETKKGEELVAKVDLEMQALNEKKKNIKDKKKVFFLYAHGAGSAKIYGKETGTHILIEEAGATNAADFTSGTKPLTAEAMIQSSPDAIIMLGRGLKALGGVEGALKLQGVGLTPAGKDKKIFQLDDSARWIGIQFPKFASDLFDYIYVK